MADSGSLTTASTGAGTGTGTETESGGPPFGQDDDVMIAEALWTSIQGRGMWPQLPGLEGVVPSGAPHDDFARIYVNQVGGDDPTFPDGTILVKENVTDMAGETLTSVTVMQRIDGFEPTAADWFWAKYLPDGTLDMNGNGVLLAGRVGLGGEMGCIPCHGLAEGGDYIYSND